MSQKQDALMAMLNQYETKSSGYQNTEKKNVDLNNYFTTYLPDKVNSANKRVRILPTSDGTTPFVEVYGHRIQVDGEWKTFACLQKEKNQPCPFCEAHDVLHSSGSESDKEFAKKYKARPMYIVKVIDRDNEDHGPKFWRFMHDYRKQGILDKIYGVLQAIKQNITDTNTGRDLLVMVARDQNRKPVVQSIAPLDPSPLSDDSAKISEWVADNRTWEDVYSLKSYDYLEIIVKGGVPVWDKDLKKFVDKNAAQSKPVVNDNMEAEIALGIPNVKPNLVVAEPTVTSAPMVPVTSDDEEDEDLPF